MAFLFHTPGKLSPICLLLLFVCCRKDKPNIEITFCNGGMVPDTVTFTESNIDGADYIWQLYDVNGNTISGPVNTGSVNSIFARLDNAGGYKLKVDVDNESSTEFDFTLRDIITEGTQRAVSFFDAFQVLWTVYPDSDCHAAVRVKQVSGIGGIDYYRAANKIYYVAGNDLIFCSPNGENLTTLEGQGFADICIEQSTGKVFIGTFGGSILQTTINNLSNAIPNAQYDAEYPVDENIGQLTFDPTGNTFYFVNGSTLVNSREAAQGAPTNQDQFGSTLQKTAIAFDVRNRRLYFAEQGSPCNIVAVNPDQPDQPLAVYQVPCEDRIEGMDIDEQESDVFYTDGENVWMFSIANPTTIFPLVTSYSKTLRKGELNFSESVEPPIGDVVIARYQD
ncbi:MAG TPA: hypothetical protein VI603_01285 [Saprospiraceae bacterium]|nr:hypothetical protein [Saprospiraceae bacterium]